MRRVLFATMLAMMGCGASPGSSIGDPEAPEAPAPIDGPLLSITPDPKTYHTTTAIAGTGPLSGTVFIDTEVDGTIARPIGDDGKFCVEIPLKKNAVNVLGVHVADLSGTESPTTEMLVTQLGDAPIVPTTPVNAALKAEVSTSNLTLVGGNEAMAVDNDPKTIADFQEELTASGGYRIRIGFAQALQAVSKIKVHSPVECSFKGFDLYASALSNANDDPASSDWVKIAISVGGSGLEEASLPAPVTMSHLMIVPTLPSCELGTFNRDHYQITDVEALSAPAAAALSPAQTCK